MSQYRRANLTISALFLFAGLGCFSGCSHTPGVYSMSNQQVEDIRSDIHTVGVVLASYSAKPEILRPAKGPVGGAGRGFVIGAALPVAVGFVTPIPFGSLLGLLVSPFTDIGGSVYGAATATPSREVAEAEAAIQQASANTRATDLRQDFLDTLVFLGSQRSDVTFAIFEGVGPKHRDENLMYDQMLEISGIDAVLEIRAEKVGLRGLYSIDPPSSVFVEIRSRLIQREDNTVWFDETYVCTSVRDLKYGQWARHGGQLIVDESFACATELAEKIIDDFFAVYPIKNW